ncbi:phage tail tube protein [Salinicola endophyticus]|uniref:Phage tail tube protein n=1 Tax=Salinicola endophyticus TaxID=1949083 RepID=A0AB74U9G0_9GAMM
MSEPILQRVGAIFVGVETNLGEAVPIEECTMILVTQQSRTAYAGNTVDRERRTEELRNFEQINTGPYATVEVTVPASGSGVPPTESAVVAPSYGLLMRACKRVEVQDLEAGEVRWEPVSGESDSITLYYIQDGEMQCLPGTRGQVTGSFQTGSLPTISFSFTGLYRRPEAIAPITAEPINQADEIPVNYQNTRKFQIRGVDFRLQSLSFDFGNTVTYRNLVGYEGVHITDKRATVQTNFEAPRIGDFDVFEMNESHKTVTTGAMAFEHGTEPGNIVGVRAPKTQFSGLSEQDSDNIMHYQMDGRCLPNAGDDELVIYAK